MPAALRSRARPHATAVALLAALVGPVGCRRDGRPNVLVISIDTLRQDHVTAYGYQRPTTPEFDRLAAEGTLYASALSPASWTLPAHASLFTGLPPSVHGVEDTTDHLNPELRTVAEVFTDAGYATAGFFSHVYFQQEYGLTRGFATQSVGPGQVASLVSEQALSWLKAHGDERFFLFLHYLDPHADYAPPPASLAPLGVGAIDPGHGDYRFLRRYLDPMADLPAGVMSEVIDLYDGEIRYADAQVGRVIDALRTTGRLDDTVVVVLSDHGEEFKDHQSMGHGYHLHAEVTRVPLVIRYPPAVAASLRIDQPVGLTDVPATLIALTGLPAERQFLARALPLPLVNGTAARPVVMETTWFGEKRFAVVDGDFTFFTRASYPVSVDLTAASGDDVYPLPDQPGVGWRPRRLGVGLFCRPDDPRELVNLLAPGAAAPGRCGGRSVDLVAVATDLRRQLTEYIRASVAGTRLLCTATAGMRITGRIQAGVDLADEAYGINFQDGDDVWPSARDDRDPTWMLRKWSDYRFAFTVGADPIGVAMPLAATTKSIRIELDGIPGLSLATEVQLPLVGRELDLAVLADGSGRCWFEGESPRTTPSGPTVLSDEQRATLRSLGYLQ